MEGSTYRHHNNRYGSGGTSTFNNNKLTMIKSVSSNNMLLDKTKLSLPLASPPEAPSSNPEAAFEEVNLNGDANSSSTPVNEYDR